MAKKKTNDDLSAAQIVQRCTGFSKHQSERVAGKLDDDKVKSLYKSGKGEELRAMIASPNAKQAEKQSAETKKE